MPSFCATLAYSHKKGGHPLTTQLLLTPSFKKEGVNNTILVRGVTLKFKMEIGYDFSGKKEISDDHAIAF